MSSNNLDCRYCQFELEIGSFYIDIPYPCFGPFEKSRFPNIHIQVLSGGAIKQTDNTIKSLVSNGINYLDSRLDFWRQQQPLYSRKKKKIDQGNRNRLIKGYPFEAEAVPIVEREYTFTTYATELASELEVLTEPSVITDRG